MTGPLHGLRIFEMAGIGSRQSILARRDVLAAAALLAGCSNSPVSGAASTRLRIVGDRVYLPVVVNGRAAEALLDSAAEASVLDTKFAAALSLAEGYGVTARGSGAATTQARLVPGVVLQVAGLELRPEAVAVIDLGDISRRLAHRPIEVIIGRELFDAARLAIDVDARVLHRIARDTEPPGVRLPLTARRGVETVPLTIEGHAAHADFDIGNGGLVLVGAGYAARNGLLDGRPTGFIGGGGIGGEAMQRTLTLRELTLAGRRFTDVPAAIDANPEAADANIGVRLLRRFGIVTDFGQRAVWLNPR